MSAWDASPRGPNSLVDMVNHPSASLRSTRIGIGCALSAHVMWGCFPLYWRLLESLSSLTLTAHRIVWSFALLIVITAIVPSMRRIVFTIPGRRTLAIYTAAAIMIGINWLAFLYAVGTDQVLQASLGYYINPLFNVLLGVVVLGERLYLLRWVAVALATVGVLIMTIAGEGVPWIALSMASAFGIYGLLKKKAPLRALEGLTLETGLLFPIAIAYFLFAPQTGDPRYTNAMWIFCALGGVITVTPLALFSIAAKRIPLSTIGILQFVGPTLQWIVGTVILGEPVSTAQLGGFVFVWAGVLVFIFGRRRKTTSH